MSRSLGCLSLTRWPPMRNSPEVMSSSPAIMLSVVDFPQPEGPTRMMNSPSAISRSSSCTATVPSGNDLVTLSSTMSATSDSFQPFDRSALDRAGRQPGDDAPLEQQHEDDDRNGDDDRGRRDGA